MSSRQKHQMNLPPMPLSNSEDAGQVLRKSEQVSQPEKGGATALLSSEQEAAALLKAEKGGPDAHTRTASELFDAAVELSAQFDPQKKKLRNPEIAHLVGVSESMVQKWRNPELRECPSLAQMVRLPLAFHLGMHSAMNRRYGFGRALLTRLLDAVGDLALAVNE